MEQRSEYNAKNWYRSLYDPTNWILVDFDGTLCGYTWPDPPGDPLPGVVNNMKRLRNAGFKIAIFTARAWQGWSEVENFTFSFNQLKEVRQWLENWGKRIRNLKCLPFSKA